MSGVHRCIHIRKVCRLRIALSELLDALDASFRVQGACCDGFTNVRSPVPRRSKQPGPNPVTRTLNPARHSPDRSDQQYIASVHGNGKPVCQIISQYLATLVTSTTRFPLSPMEVPRCLFDAKYHTLLCKFKTFAPPLWK
ncbi:hypothetical protein HPB50_000858 [Hyalomma asiaticum]|uniref:Uncharacterized protein n=1 Tax=Hyalomma asiaticum TaxID=266040 RepID=A0ACB7SB68_HYAAI|nr:hypothetical protein HPB50_000858 [Hyalomma asiaticum]